MKSIALWLSLLLLLLFSGTPQASGNDLTGLMPLKYELDGWKLDESYMAVDADSLMARINGAGPFYLKRGSKEVLFQEYIKGSQYISVELYRMTNRKSARKLYNDIDAVKPEPLQDLGEEGRFDGSLIGSYLVEFRHSMFFVRIMISHKSAASKQTILKFAKIISSKISALN